MKNIFFKKFIFNIFNFTLNVKILKVELSDWFLCFVLKKSIKHYEEICFGSYNVLFFWSW